MHFESSIEKWERALEKICGERKPPAIFLFGKYVGGLEDFKKHPKFSVLKETLENFAADVKSQKIGDSFDKIDAVRAMMEKEARDNREGMNCDSEVEVLEAKKRLKLNRKSGLNEIEELEEKNVTDTN